jgi:hypothetical protein
MDERAEGKGLAVARTYAPVAVDEDGYVFELLTGEVVGLASEGVLAEVPFERPDGTVELVAGWSVVEAGEDDAAREWTIATEADADRVLERISRAESRAVAVGMLREQVLARLGAEERRFLSRAEWERRRWGSQLEAFARKQLGGGKRKTLNLAHGSVAFRKTQGRTTLTNMAEAVAWAEENHPEIVRVAKSVTATAARKAVEEDLKSGFLDEEPLWIEIAPPGDSCRIETGIRTTARAVPARAQAVGSSNQGQGAALPGPGSEDHQDAGGE